jgi:hypothetical protein
MTSKSRIAMPIFNLNVHKAASPGDPPIVLFGYDCESAFEFGLASSRLRAVSITVYTKGSISITYQANTLHHGLCSVNDAEAYASRLSQHHVS